MSGTISSCSCADCQKACEHKPGWLLPGEAERIADHLGVSADELFATSLAVDSSDEFGGSVLVLSPGIVGLDTGREFPPDESTGTCVFFEDGSCTVHAVKPYECRQMLHGQPNDEARQRIIEAWGDRQEEIRNLLDAIA